MGVGFLVLVVSLFVVACQGASDPSDTASILYGSDQHGWRGRIVHLSWSPRAFLVKNFLSDEECNYLITLAKPSMTKSAVVDNETGASKPSDIRTSTGTFFSKGQDEVISKIEERVAQVTMIPTENQEGLQLLNYVDGQKYEPHFDYFHDHVNAAPERGGQRLVTVLMYLSTPEEGGETVFPNAATKVEGPEWSECAKQGLAVKAMKGDALIFYSLTPDGNKDTASLHGSCPTTKGEKWSATKWIHVGSFNLDANHQKAKWGDCIDADINCLAWSKVGECKKNPGYMLTHCRLACKVCQPGKNSTEEN